MNPPTLFDAMGGVHRGDPVTSVAAAVSNRQRAGHQRAAVLAAVVDAGARGLTAEEAGRATGMPVGASGCSAAKRLSELKQRGLVEPSGFTRPTVTGHAAQVLIATAEGRDALLGVAA